MGRSSELVSSKMGSCGLRLLSLEGLAVPGGSRSFVGLEVSLFRLLSLEGLAVPG